MKENIQVESSGWLGCLPAILRLFLFAIALSGALVWILTGGGLQARLSKLGWFQIDQIQVNSEWPLTPSTVESWLPALKGQNLLFLRPSDLIADLDQRPWVESVTLHKIYPSSLNLEIKTKRAVAVAILNGRPNFIDANGLVIDRASPSLLRALDLPVISWQPEAKSSGWDLNEVIRVIQTFRFRMNDQADISQVVLEDRPYFRLFLSTPKMQVEFNLENWESQLPILALLLHSPPSQIDQPRSINLTLPKRAVITTPARESSTK
jgi:hypothetical protein